MEEQGNGTKQDMTLLDEKADRRTGNKRSGRLRSAMVLLEEYVQPLITEDQTKLSLTIPRIVQVMNMIFPIIIQDYTLSAFAERQEELSQWTGLLAQILETLDGNDTFAKIDMIAAVLLPNLEEHVVILQEHGL